MAADLAYPVFSGFRAREALKMARLQQQSDEIYTAVLRSTVAFEAPPGLLGSTERSAEQ